MMPSVSLHHFITNARVTIELDVHDAKVFSPKLGCSQRAERCPHHHGAQQKLTAMNAGRNNFNKKS
jgi:hypothetical protein